MIRVADYIMNRIAQENVGHVFYVPGGQCVYLMDALRRCEQLAGISVHHEQAAAMAALSYSLYNDNMGACVVTTGCAGTNTMTGVLHAWQDSIPCIFVSGQQNVEHTIGYTGLPLRQVGVQEADIVALVTPITKYAVMLKNANDVAYELDKAFYLAQEGRKGPVWLDVPLNIQNAMVDENGLRRYVPENNTAFEMSQEDLAYVISRLNAAERPVILAGHGVRSADAAEELQVFVEMNHIPVIFTRFSMDLLPYEHPFNFGIVGSAGASRYANFIVQNADFVLCIGTRLSIDTTGPAREQFAREAIKIVVDIDEVEHSKKGVAIDKLVVSDAKDCLTKLEKSNIKMTNAWWIEKCNHWKTLFPSYQLDHIQDDVININYFLDVLSSFAPDNSAFVSDAGMTGVAVPTNSKLKASDRMIHSFAQGEMGYVLPAALGVACICKGTVIAITGDGSVMMNLQELQTLVRNQFNVKLVINNNNGYSGVRHGQKAHFRGKSIGTDASNGIDFPDFGKVAAAFGIDYVRIEKTSEIDDKLKQVFAVKGPCICEVITDPEQFDLHNALVMYGKRKFGFRPIEDQSPFIDRETFFEEMIVEPMETSYGKPV